MITEQERNLITKLAEFWNAFLNLPDTAHVDREETMRDIHNIQNRIAARATWRLKEPDANQTNSSTQSTN